MATNIHTDDDTIHDADTGQTADALPFDPDAFPFSLEEFQMDDASVDGRDGEPTYPYRGASVWLVPFPAPTSMIEGALALQGEGKQQATALPLLREGIAACVAGHTLRNPRTGEYYDQFWRNPDALSDVPPETLYDLISIIQNGEISAARKKGLSNGRAGTTTRLSTARKTSASTDGHGRR